jgi:hypothetical protein
MDGKMSREDIKDGARGFAMDYCLNEEYPTGFSGYMAGFLKGYDFRQDEIDLLNGTVEEFKRIYGVQSAAIEKHSDQLKQLESQLLAQKTLNEVTVEYLEEKLKKAEGVISYYAGDDDSGASWLEPDNGLMYWTLWDDGACVGGDKARQYFSDKDDKT